MDLGCQEDLESLEWFYIAREIDSGIVHVTTFVLVPTIPLVFQFLFTTQSY